MKENTEMVRTDLALELREEVENGCALEGVRVFTKTGKNADVKETRIEVLNEAGEKNLGKPIGTYITLESEALRQNDEGIHEPFTEALFQCLCRMIGDKRRILVVGLGNRAVTPDALGPYVVDNLYITRHLINEGIYDSALEISALCPGVMAQTGIETLDILKAVVEEIKPDIVIAVDALAAKNANRLNSTIQIADTGISPGSGVGNNRKALTEKELGCKVVAIGVPTVISVPAIVNDSMDIMLSALGRTEARKVVEEFTDEERYQLASEMVEPYLASMFVTPKNIDEAVKRVSYTISEAINRLLDVY